MQTEILHHSVLTLSNRLCELEETGCAAPEKHIRALCAWAVDALDRFYSEDSFLELYKGLMELAPLMDSPDQNAVLPRRTQHELLPRIIRFMEYLMQQAPVRAKLSPQAMPYRACFHAEKLAREPAGPSAEQPLVITISGTAKANGCQPDTEVPVSRIFNQVFWRCPVDGFCYDRLYLQGKLDALARRPEVRIWITGSSYAMVGVQEALMPRAALNAAVNAQDIYYSLLCAERAVSLRPELDTIILPLAYYFFFSDMADNPSDYTRSVLCRVNIPVFGDRHGYQGPLLPEYPAPRPGNPLLDALYDIERFRALVYSSISRELSGQAYFNSGHNRRPAGGMLSYCFREKSDEQNLRAAAARAQAHNGNYCPVHGRDNGQLLDAFLERMEAQGRRVILFVPPVTDFYRAFVSKEMQDHFYKLVNPVVQKRGCIFLDLFESPEFTRLDFQDYDHLNDQGAKKLSKLLAGLCV